MNYCYILKILFSFILIGSFFSIKAQSIQLQKDKLLITTKKDKSIRVNNGSIYYNNKLIYKYKEDGIIYNSKYNTIIEDTSILFLFLTIYGSPNKNRIEAFRLTTTKAIKLADAIASKIEDFDNDGFLEFGGAGLTEVHPNKDSMYYIPTAYYEIKNGSIHLDKSLTRQKDIELNGIYLKQPLDREGNCCKVIRKPHHKKKIN